MIKRKVALIFTLFASIILLAATIVPHSHHEGSICIINSFGQPVKADNQHDNSSHSHDHKACDEYHYCLFDQELFLPSNGLENYLKALNSDDILPCFDGSWISSVDAEFVKYVPPEFGRIQFAHGSSFYSRYLNQSIGLRGPPTA